jgi:hypothetical protein
VARAAGFDAGEGVFHDDGALRASFRGVRRR